MAKTGFVVIKYSPWPIFISMGVLGVASTFINFLHSSQMSMLEVVAGSGSVFFLLGSIFGWFLDLIYEGTRKGNFTSRVKWNFRFGFALFIISEVFFFFSFFWAWVNHGVGEQSQILLGVWPPKGVYPMSPWGIPLVNTMLLIGSGFTVTLCQRCVLGLCKFSKWNKSVWKKMASEVISSNPKLFPENKLTNKKKPSWYYSTDYIPVSYLVTLNEERFKVVILVKKKNKKEVPSGPRMMRKDVKLFGSEGPIWKKVYCLQDIVSGRKQFYKLADRLKKHALVMAKIFQKEEYRFKKKYYGRQISGKEYYSMKKVIRLRWLAILAMVVTIGLGVVFLFLQYVEYKWSSLTMSDGCYGSCFFMLTGFHGMHVVLGLFALTGCLIRIYCNHFLHRRSYTGLKCAIAYWHFVDVVWIFLLVIVYIWPYYMAMAMLAVKFGWDV